jgi:hypothetical protein
MKPHLSKAAETLRAQINERYPGRDKTSDGWLGDSAHASRPSDHNPAKPDGVVRAIDVDRDLSGRAKPDVMPYLADQIRLCAKNKHDGGRLSYIIFDGKIASSKKSWAWRTYDGINKHNHHCHISFTPKGDKDGKKFAIPLFEG